MKNLPKKYGIVKLGNREYIYDKEKLRRQVERLRREAWKDRILGELKEDGSVVWKNS